MQIDKSEYTQVIELIRGAKQCVLVSGSAGTGKTTFIDYLSSEEGRKDLPYAHNMGIVAPTGIAAMQAGGVTVHSFFRFPPRLYDYETQSFVDGETIKPLRAQKSVISAMELLVIDEVSMVRADLMDAIDLSMRINRAKPDLPFGGVKILLVGDIFQIQPVITSNDYDFLQAKYGDNKSMFFFNSVAIRGLIARDMMGFVELKIARRFTNLDKKPESFYQILNRIRKGNTDDLGKINHYLAREAHCERLLENNAVLLTGIRAAAEKINLRKLDELSGETKTYEGQVEGQCKNYDDNRLPAPRTMNLKVGAQIIFVRNDSKARWVNGTLGIIEDFIYEKERHIDLVIVKILDGGMVVRVEREEWKMVNYKYNADSRKIEAEEAGSYIQFPFLLAWAMTIHRAQGRTLPKVVIDLKRGAFSAGQAYVALSRCREAKDLGLRSPLSPRDIICHDDVVSFHQKHFGES